MDCRRLLLRGQIGHFLHIGRDRRRQLRRHRLLRHFAGIGLAVVHRIDEGAIAPGGAVALVEQRLQHLFRRVHLPGYPQRGGVAAAQFGIVGRSGKRGLIVALGPCLVAGQVARQPALHQDAAVGETQPLRLIEQTQRLGRVLKLQHNAGQPRLDPAIATLDRVGAREEARCAMGVIQRQRRLARPDHRVDVARVGGEPRKIAVEVGSAKRPDQVGLIGLGGSGMRGEQRGEDPGKRLCHISLLADAMLNGKLAEAKSAPGRSGRPTARSGRQTRGRAARTLIDCSGD